MAHSSFARSLSEVSGPDGSLCKTILDGTRDSASGSSVTTSVLVSKMLSNKKTPTRTPKRAPLTPFKMDNDLGTTGSRKTPNKTNKSLIEREGDRFIPNRQSTDLTRAQHAMKQGSESRSSEDAEYQRAVAESLLSTECNGTRILRYKTDVRELMQNAPVKAVKSPMKKTVNTRVIPQTPEKILDAPEILDDFYLNILDWSVNNVLAVALNDQVYLWNASSGDIACLMSTGLEGELVTSLSWSPDAPYAIAIGTSAGRIQLWNTETQALLRTMRLGDAAAVGRVPVLTWREHIVTSGSRCGHIRHHDTRIAEHQVGIADYHSQEVCGLAWSADKRYLASGSNDNGVAIWSTSAISQLGRARPEMVLTEHQSAVKALAWCPWKNNLLCTGGGTTDHTLRFWNTTNGNCAKSVDVTAQVSGIIWNSEYREIVTSHGLPKNQLIVWRYPNISMSAQLAGHQGRVLNITSSPDNEMVASCAADETIRIWHCFQTDHMKKHTQEKVVRSSALTRNLR